MLDVSILNYFPHFYYYEQLTAIWPTQLNPILSICFLQKIEDVNCCDATNFTYNVEDQDERKSRFPKPVNFTYSTVHTPTEVYEGGRSLIIQ